VRPCPRRTHTISSCASQRDTLRFLHDPSVSFTNNQAKRNERACGVRGAPGRRKAAGVHFTPQSSRAGRSLRPNLPARRGPDTNTGKS
jgi:hypothetical protein